MPAWANSTQRTIEISAHAPNTSTQSRIYTISRHVHTERTGAAGQSNFYSPGIVWHDATHSAKFSFPTPDRPTCVLSAVEICGHRTGVEILPSRKVGSLYFRLPTSDFQLPTYRYTDAKSHMANEREREPLFLRDLLAYGTLQRWRGPSQRRRRLARGAEYRQKEWQDGPRKIWTARCDDNPARGAETRQERPAAKFWTFSQRILRRQG